MKDSKIKETLSLIYDMTGLELEAIKPSRRRYYFDVKVNEMISESLCYHKLIRFSNKYNLIRVEPNGCRTLAIFPLK